MIRFTQTILLVAMLTVAGCQTTKLTNISAPTPEMERVQEATAQWPESPADEPAVKRSFFATIRIAGHRTTASGLLQFHNARDFRITAATEMGVILFDGRMNWAGVTVLRAMPGVEKTMIASLIKDLATAFALPEDLRGLQPKGADLVLKRKGADTNDYTWTFDIASGRLRQTDVDRGFFDKLQVRYLRYNARGWPEEMAVESTLYKISFTYTDSDDVAKR